MDIAIYNEKMQHDNTTGNTLTYCAGPPGHCFIHAFHQDTNQCVQFSHQLLGNPRISTLLKAVRQDFLNGCPNTVKNWY
jgi:hypothetical protein